MIMLQQLPTELQEMLWGHIESDDYETFSALRQAAGLFAQSLRDITMTK